MVGFKSDRQRKGFFASKGNSRSDVQPRITRTGLPRVAVVRRFVKLRKIGFTFAEADKIARSAKDTRLALQIEAKKRIIGMK